MSPAKKKEQPSDDGGAQRTYNSAVAAIKKMTSQKPIEQQAGGPVPCVSSGSTLINALISGAMIDEGSVLSCPGYPRRRITEIYGPESSGKTTAALMAIVEVQKIGGTAMFLDLEHALDHRYARRIGVKFNEQLLLYQPDTMEEAFKMILVGLVVGVDLIVVDSVAAMVPKGEMEKSFDDPAKVGVVAQKMAQNLPKLALWLSQYPMDKEKKPRKDHPGTALILLNQERALINTSGGGGHGESTNTTGGKALKFFTYLRLRFQRFGSESVKRKDKLTGKERAFPFGNITNVKVVKTKVTGNQGDSTLIFIRFGFGIDDLYSLIEVGSRMKVVDREGAYYSFGGTRIQGRDKFRAYFLGNQEAAEQLRQAVLAEMMASAPKVVADEELSEEDQVVAEVASAMPDADVEETTVESDDEDPPEEG